MNAGRESRGAEKGDVYKVGDFLRGIGHSVSKATKSGVEIRSGGKGAGKERKGNVIDYTVGTSSALKNYVGKNQAKLVGAGTATAAMTVGTVLLGPAGLVAGAAVGTLTEKIIEKSIGKQDDHDGTSLKGDQDKSGQSLKDAFNMVPQGLLFKRRDFFRTEWVARWFILDVPNKTLNNHLITQNSPPKVDTNVLNVLSKPAATNTESHECIDFKLEPNAGMQLSKAKVTVVNTLSVKHNLFPFTVVDGDNQSWHLAATSDEARSIWMTILMDLSDFYTYDDIVKET